MPDYNTRYYLLLENGFRILLESGDGYILLEEGANPGVDILNLDATFPTSNYLICARSGFRARPGELVLDPYSRDRVLPQYLDTDVQHGSRHSSKARGSRRPEQDDNFISVAVTSDDL